MYLTSNPDREGQDRVTVNRVQVSDDRKRVFLEIPDIKPVMQMQIGFILKSADGTELRQTIYNTIHKVPAR